MPKVLDMLGYSASEIGMLFAAGPMVRFLLPFLFTKGLTLDAKSFKIALLIMLLSSASFYLSIHSFYQLLYSVIGFGIGLSLILPYIEVVSLEYIGKERYGKVRLFGSVGFILVSLILVKFLNSYIVAINFLFTFSFLTSVVAILILQHSHNVQKSSEKITNDIHILRDWKLWLGLTLVQVGFGGFYNFFTIYETDHGVSLNMTVYLWSFGVLVEIFMLYFQGRFLRGNLLNILKITTFAGAFRWFLLFLFPQNIAILFFAQSIHALSFALFHSSAISYLFHLYKHKSLAQQFFSGITYGLGGFIGAILAGYIYQYYPEYLFLSSSFIALLSFYFIHLWSKSLVINN